MYWILNCLLFNCYISLSYLNVTEDQTYNFTSPTNEITNAFFNNETTTEITYNENVTDIINITEATPDVFIPTEETFHDFNLSSSKTSNKFFSICEECFCDVTADLCDMNCCCDTVCTIKDVQVFSACDDLILPISRKFCFKHNVFYNANIKYEIIKMPDDLYCVIPVTPKQQKCFTEHEPIYSQEEQELLSKNKRFFSLPSKTSEYCGFNLLKVGDPIFVHMMDSGEYRILGLPNPSFGICNRMQMAKYMMDKKVTCYTVISSPEFCEFMEILNGNTFHQGMQVIGNMSIQPFICNSSMYCDPVDKVPKPSYNETSNVCENVVNYLEYIIIHDGINGVKRINLNLVLTNISVVEDTETRLPQTFSINYLKNNYSENDPDVYRFVGYQQGDPVLTSYGNEMNKLYISGNLTVVSADASNACNNKEQVLFGINIITSCILHVNIKKNEADEMNETCSIMGEKVTEVLHNNDTLYYIGKFKYARPMMPNEWILLFYEYQYSTNKILKNRFFTDGEFCQDIIVSSHTIILYSLTGHKSNPKAEIIGVTRKFTKGGFVFLSSNLISVHISSTVSFIDITETH